MHCQAVSIIVYMICCAGLRCRYGPLVTTVQTAGCGTSSPEHSTIKQRTTCSQVTPIAQQSYNLANLMQLYKVLNWR